MHHYLPRFYLREFCDPEILKRENRLVIWVYEKDKPVRRGSPDKEARERDFYAFNESGASNTEVEEWFAALEGKVAATFPHLHDQHVILSSDQKECLAEFIGTMFLRTPAGRIWHEKRVGPAVSEYLTEAAADPQAFVRMLQSEELPMDQVQDVEGARQEILGGRHEALAKLPGLNLAAMVDVGRMIAGKLLELDWQVVHSKGAEFFIMSDSPVVPEMRDDLKGLTYFWMGVDREGVNVWFPISRTVCLRMKRGIDSGRCQLRERGVRMVNKNLMLCAHHVIYAAERSQELSNLFNRHGCKSSLESSDMIWQGRQF